MVNSLLKLSRRCPRRSRSQNHGWGHSFSIVLVCCIVFGGAISGFAQKPESRNESRNQKRDTQKDASDSNLDVIDGQRREEVMKFVRKNHPELQRLIESLREKRPEQYQAALRSVDKAVTKLNDQKTKNELRYENALEDWKLQSRIQLLSARLSLEDTPARRERLQELLAMQQDKRIQQLELARDQVRQRLDRLNEAVSQTKKNRNIEIKRRLGSVIKTAERAEESRMKKAASTEEARNLGKVADKKPDSRKNNEKKSDKRKSESNRKDQPKKRD